jgi:sterol desaturase/sphingolipid hydroxylase (fatty acid hydroxylase superfamily)
VTFHELHHKHVSCNYGCVFTFWDRLLGTVHSSTDQVFREVSSRSRADSPEPLLAIQTDLPGLRAEEQEV